MSEIWESIFKSNKEVWGLVPAPSALIAKDFFLKKRIKKILIPGFGYGRNAQVFIENGIKVTGIEISKTAIERGRELCGSETIIHHGSVLDMPFDDILYEGIFCYALVHLFDSEERLKFIQDCYNQLSEDGFMIFIVVSKKAPNYGSGKLISKNRYEVQPGLSLYFYDENSIKAEFEGFGLVEVSEINENLPFYIIKCKKNAS
ncbi:MAG TPA: class I SAM-dependent methyltransferase [Brumimicrobium sp.]|nr:class I SAM-dependent methyltransferase [Brumimicrobium sp.]